ncbi:transglycosylase family protein [Nakamurella alba]|uniref:transglycosylase family protein n=1 Tax=Nakamurella alba TaxID=2665158 RepID=UPI00254644F1|nr:transglycosylase family protein [Nakamurella alba]
MRRVLALAAAAVAVAATALALNTTSALADPSANAWASVRQCESGGNYSINTGNGYYGAYQFDLGTWRSVGGTGTPSSASAAEQDYRALYLYRMRGWSPWICASLAGLSEDSSARSGVVPTRAESAYMSGGTGSYAPPDTSQCNVGGSTAPPWGGTDMVQGKTYRDMMCWQRQMGHLGYGLSGSGYFGSNTLSALHRFQSAKGLARGNVVNRAMWVAAWGKDGGNKAGVTPTTTAAPKPTTTPKPTTPKPTTSAAADLYPGNTATSCKVGASKAPAWPGRSWTMGAMDKALGCWQMQMATRGYTDLHGNGYYGSNTFVAAKDIQNRNNLGGSGLIGPKTWAAAWEGKAKK